MKVTLNWLRQYVDFDWSPEELAERLTMLGLEVESVQKVSGAFEGVVVAQILTKDKLPGADKLSVCKVNDGKAERTIVCGAQNHNAGDKVPLILPNFPLPLKPGEQEPFVIKERKVFGVTSQGMMCSPQELGLPDPIEGLLILPADAPVGKPFGEYMGRSGSDVVYDLEITPNRPDWNSVVGIAREIAAVTGNPLKLPEISISSEGRAAEGRATRVPNPLTETPVIRSGEEIGTRVARPSDALPSDALSSDALPSDARPSVRAAGDLVAVRLEDSKLCPRYTARVVRGVKIGPSPDWLRSTLEKVGIRSISNVVDVTNYVMLEIGQPLHAFDYHLIAKSADGKPTIVVRRATAGEKFTTLDGQARTLTEEMLLIADERKGIALAGIMGGQNTEINDQTVDVLVESAHFNPTGIRRTSKTLGLRSESSYRFERGSDPNICDWASRRAVQLILETAGGEAAEGVVDAYPAPVTPARVTLRHQKTNELLGLSLKAGEIEFYLGQLGLRTVDRKIRPVGESGPADPVTFEIPTFRPDLKREVDLIEEVARLHGVDKIPATSPRGAIGSNAYDAIHDQLAEARRILTGLGLYEAQGQTLISSAELRDVKPDQCVLLANPLSSDMDVLRPSLLPGLIHSLRHNLSRKNNDVALFEVGRVFYRVEQAAGRGGKGAAPATGEKILKEERRLAIALTGQRSPAFWSGTDRDAKFDTSDLKGLVEEFFEQFGIRGATFTRRAESTQLFLESATIQLGRLPLGEMGQLQPALSKRYDLRDAVLLLELNLDQLLARRNPSRSFKKLPGFPSSRRDVAMLVPESTTHDAVLDVVRKAKPANLESVELFDIFRGKHVPEGQKSMAYAFTYRNAERTLTDAEVNSAQEKVIEQLRAALQANIRDAVAGQ